MPHSITYYEQVIESQKRTIQALHAEIAWRDALDASPKFDASTKLFIARQAKAERREVPNPDGRYRIDMTARAGEMGMSPSSVSRKAALLAEHGLIESDGPVKYVKQNGEQIDLVFGRLSADLLTEDGVTGLDPAKLRPWGGDHYVCQSCGGRIQRKTRILRTQEIVTCTSCGEVTVYPPVDIAAPDPRYLDREQVVQEEQVTTFEQLEPTHGDEGVTSPEQLVQQENLQSFTYPDTPPHDDCEKEAAALLLEVAGRGVEHIEMNRDPELTRKYTTVKRRMQIGDLRAHLHGKTTKGATLQHPFGMTRALCFDADTQEGYQQFEQAARSLSCYGFQPLLEPSPVPAGGEHAGGGHLWIVFDAVVDCYSARETVYQYAPALREVAEYWPRIDSNLKVRLPGGKYVTPTFSAWCSLTDADGNELSHDGASAAQVLLTHQTSSKLVKAYQKPAPALQLQQEENQPAPPRGVPGKPDDRPIVAAINDSFTWDQLAHLCGGWNRERKFSAVWRGENVPSVSVNPRTDRAKDFGRPDEPPMDRYDVWCHIQGGNDWRTFKRRDFDERCRRLRGEQERRAS